MKFSKDNMKKKSFPVKSGSIDVFEYSEENNFMIDGAIAVFNATTELKTNEHFDELLYVISGEVEITEEDISYKLAVGEMAIIKKGIKHKIGGYNNSKVFIVCNPPFNHNPSVEYDNK